MNDEVLMTAVDDFRTTVSSWERRLRSSGSAVAPANAREAIVEAFWHLFATVRSFERDAQGRDLTSMKRRFRDEIVWTLARSRFHWRSIFHPHGYAGDYMMIEWMYDLEASGTVDPSQPAIVGCLDAAYATLDSVQAVWERRHRLADLISSEFQRRGRRLRILDVACGGSRYLHDFLSSVPEALDSVSATLLDQDVAVRPLVEDRFRPWSDRIRFVCLPIKNLAAADLDGPFDLIVSSELFDYLDQPTASALVHHLSSRLTQDGLLALTNFSPEDRSAIAKDWVGWQIVYRTEEQIRGLFPHHLVVSTAVSENRSLVYATGRLDEKAA